MTTLPPILTHGNTVGASTPTAAPFNYDEALAKSMPSLTSGSAQNFLTSSESTLDGFTNEDDNYSVSSYGSESSFGSENTFDFMSGKVKSKRRTEHLDTDESFFNLDCGGRQISPMKMFSGVSSRSHLSDVLSNITYENGRRKSLTDTSASNLNSGLHRQIEADLLQHRNLVALKVDGSKFANIARIHIEVDSKVASTMAARTFVDTTKIEVHQRRSSIDGLPTERHRSGSTERRGSASHGSLVKLPAPLSLPPVASTLRRGSGEVQTAGDNSSTLDPLQYSQLRRAGRVVAASRRLLMGGMQDQVVGTVECLASDRTTFRQPRFAQATVGSLMAIKG